MIVVVGRTLRPGNYDWHQIMLQGEDYHTRQAASISLHDEA